MAKVFSEKAQKVLVFLKKTNSTQNVTASDIAEETEINKRSITGVINGLVRKGLVMREPSGDVKYIVLTDKGYEADPLEEKEE